MSLKLNVGCGQTPTEGWENFDNSPALRLAGSQWQYELAKLLRILDANQIQNVEWNRENRIMFADATKCIPVPDGSASAIYTSHMLEHLSRRDAEGFLKEALRVLQPGGVLRVGVPDLRLSVESYLKNEDADAFIEDIYMAPPEIENWKDKIKILLLGFRHHQWMYDGRSLVNFLNSRGFSNAQICLAGDTRIADPGNLNLYERAETTVYVEAVRP